MNRNNRNKTIFWKITLICFGLIALSSGVFKESNFWSGYVLDIAGPAWIYMLIRAQYNSKGKFFNIKFSPELALFLIITLSFATEIMQYFEVYNSTYDPFDFLAYVSGTFVIYIIDKIIIKKEYQT